MKRMYSLKMISAIFGIVLVFKGSSFAQMTATTLIEQFNGSYDGNNNISYSYNAGTLLSTAFQVNHWDNSQQVNGNGTTTGTSTFAYRKTGSSGASLYQTFASTPNIMGLTLNTPDATTYTNVYTYPGYPHFDSRYSLVYWVSGNYYTGTNRVDITSNRNLTLKVNNLSNTSGSILIELCRNNANSAAGASDPRTSATRAEFHVPANQTKYITYDASAGLGTNASISGVLFRFSGFGPDGQIELDDLTLGLALPTSVLLTATGAATTVLGGDLLQLGGVVNTGDAFFQNLNLVEYSLQASQSNVATILGNGQLQTNPNILIGVNPVVTVTATSVYNTNAKGIYILTVIGNSSVHVPVTGVSISGPSTVSAIGSMTLTANVTPNDASNPTVTWSSSNTAIATVGVSNGIVSGVSPGVVTITATSVDNATVSGTHIVTVVATPWPATFTGTRLKETFDADWSGNFYFPGPTNWPFVPNTSFYISTSVTNDITIGRAAYFMRNATGISMNPTDIYANMGAGALRVNVNTPDPNIYGNFSDVILFNGVRYDSRYFMPYTLGQSGNFNLGTGGMDISGAPNITMEITNLSTTSGHILFDFFNNRDRFNTEGPNHRRSVVLAPGLNRVRFRLDTENDNLRGFLIRTSGLENVGLDIDNIRIGFTIPTSITQTPLTSPVTANTTVQMAASLLPLGVEAEYPEIVWSVLTPSLASISGTGVLHAFGTNGLVTVRAASPWVGSVFIDQVVSITGGVVPVTGLSIDGPSTIAITNPATNYSFTTTVTPADASNPNVSWTLSGEAATIASSDNSSAEITPLTAGVVTLTAISLENSSILFHKIINILPLNIPIAGITVIGETLLTVGGTSTYQTLWSPANATDTTIIWSVSDNTVATISGIGILTALSPGTVDVIATYAAVSSIVGVLEVTIVPLPEQPLPTTTGISINPVLNSLSIYPNPVSTELVLNGVDDIESSSVYNNLGELVLHSVEKKLNVSILPKGIYLIVVKGKAKTHTGRFVKE